MTGAAWRVLGLVAVTIILFPLVMYETTRRSYIEQHRLLLDYQANDEFAQSFIRSYFESYFPEQRVCINQRYESNCLNIIIYQITGPQARRQINPKYRRNLVAIGSNVIGIDARLFDLLLVTSHSAMLSRAADLFFSDLPPLTTFTLWAQEYVNLRRNESQGWITTHAASAKHALRALESDKYKYVFPNGVERWYSQIMAASLSMLVEHEIGHLHVTPFQRLIFRLKSALRLDFAALSREEEEYVDSVAFQRTEHVIERMHAKWPASKESGIALSSLLSNFLFFWTEGSFEFFEHLRGELYAEDFLFEILYKDCHIDEKIFAVVPSMMLATVPEIALARLRPLPILTESEFTRLNQHIRSVVSHSHALHRADALLRRIQDALRTDDADYDFAALGLLPGLYDAALAGKRSFGAPQKARLLSTTIRTADLLRKMHGAGIVPERGFLCPEIECFVYVDGASAIEILSDQTFVTEVRMLAPLEVIKADSLFEKVISQLAASVGTTAQDVRDKAEGMVGQCPGVFRLFAAGGQYLYISRSATKGYVALRFLRIE